MASDSLLYSPFSVGGPMVSLFANPKWIFYTIQSGRPGLRWGLNGGTDAALSAQAVRFRHCTGRLVAIGRPRVNMMQEGGKRLAGTGASQSNRGLEQFVLHRRG